jgi:hypothetical protein
MSGIKDNQLLNILKIEKIAQLLPNGCSFVDGQGHGSPSGKWREGLGWVGHVPNETTLISEILAGLIAMGYK